MRSGLRFASLKGQRHVWPLVHGALRGLCRFLLVCALFDAPSVYGQDVEYAHDISGKLNPTGRTVVFPVPLNDDQQLLGEVLIQITAADAILVEKAGLTRLIFPVVEAPVVAAVETVPDRSGFIPIESFAETGLRLVFDNGLQELQLGLSADQRPSSDLRLGGLRRGMKSTALTHPESFSGYLNVTVGLDQVWNDQSRGGFYEDQPSGRVDLDSAVRMGGVVFENRASYEGESNFDICPEGAICTYGDIAGLKRQTSRLIYDLPDQEIRMTAGDTEPLVVPFQRATDLLGVSIEKSPRKLNPGENISSTGSGSFRLDRPALVDVHVNGASSQQLRLRPGNYNLRDLPLSTGANDIELIIQDDSGERRTLAFSAYSDPNLLAAGKSEWAATAGVPSYLIDNQRSYSSGDWMGSGFYRYGFSDELTVEADLQADLEIIMAGAGFDLGTPFGVFGINAAASTGSYGSGVAADLSWTYSNFEGLTGTRQESLNFYAEYRSTDFRTPGEFLSTANGIFFPEQEYWLRLEGYYTMPLFADVTASLSGRYQFDNDERQSLTPYRLVGDRYGADVTLSTPIGETATGSLLVGYSNELYPRAPADQENVDPEFRVALRVTVRNQANATLSGGYDTLGNQATLSAYKSEGSGIGRWDTSVDAQIRGYDETGSVGATAGYWGNRGEVRLSHFADFDSLDLSTFDGSAGRQRTSLRVGSAIAFAGDKVAIGPPVRGGAFAIVAAHESLSDSEVRVGTETNTRAKADAWGPALVPDIPAYAPNTTSIDVDDLPLGYSLGSGAFETFAPYKAGYVFQVGSENSVSVYGTLLKGDGTPLGLLTGLAKPEGMTGSPVAIFTNAEGRFGAEGLGPGRWLIEMADEDGPVTYVVDVPEGATGLVKVGDLLPSGGDAL